MTLTVKDLFATLLAGGILGLWYVVNQGLNLPVVSGWGYRGGILLLAVAGIVMCALATGATSQPTGLFKFVASALGIAAVGLIIYGLIVGTKTALILVAGVILALWVISTVRHLFGL